VARLWALPGALKGPAMGGKRPLKGGLPRLFADCRSVPARACRRHYDGLRQRYELTDRVTLDFAAGVASAYGSWRAVTAQLTATERLRVTGKGRRPSAQAVERLRRRQGLEWSKYESALRPLEELASASRKAPTNARELLEQRTAETRT